jgi:large subunit ribosomal protein L5
MATKHSSLHEFYTKEVRPRLQQEAGYPNVMAVPRLSKVVLNVGLGKSAHDPKLSDLAVKTLERISGQRPVMTKAKKSISNFKIRQGQAIGAMVTLRGEHMYSFLDKLIHVALPRVKDFRGLQVKTIDAHGNLSIGFREHIVFPEIRSDEIESIHGLEVAIITTAHTREQGKRLFELLGFPFSS